MALIETALLAKNIALLAAVPPEARAASDALAVKTLVDLKARAGIIGLAEYGNRLAKVLVAEPTLKEPWAAFKAGGPGSPPPAVALLRPPDDTPGAGMELYNVFLNWTGPGQMYKILSGQGLPTNGLLDAMKAAVGDAADMFSGLIQTAIIAVVVVGGIYFVITRKG